MKHIAIPVLLLAAGLTAGQDMPLHEIIKPGETWQPYAGALPARTDGAKPFDRSGQPLRAYSRMKDGIPDEPRYEFKEPWTGLVSPDGATYFVVDGSDRYVWALRKEADGKYYVGDRYCRLRVAGDDRRKKVTRPEAYRADPSALAIDGAGRLYVATGLGIQVFDPTGRLCGVFTAPPGRVTELVFENDRLYAKVGDKVFVRTMLATGR